MIANRREKKYQMIKLIKSGRSMRETKSMMKAVTVGLFPEYVKLKDMMDLQALEGGIHTIAMTRNDANQLAKIKFGPRKGGPKGELVGKFATGYRGRVPLDWKRDGNLIRRGKQNKTRVGSSKRVPVGRTQVIGADKALKDFKTLIENLRAFQKMGKKDHKSLQKAMKGLRVSTSTKG